MLAQAKAAMKAGAVFLTRIVYQRRRVLSRVFGPSESWDFGPRALWATAMGDPLDRIASSVYTQNTPSLTYAFREVSR